MTDTGSTDESVSILKSDKFREIAGCPVYVHHFEWVDDFGKARQFSFDQVPAHIDYVMWMDLDDVLSSKEAFCHFRDNTLHCADMWLLPYNYAFKGDLPTCVFLRERIVRNKAGFSWRFFIHEGIVPDGSRKIKAQQINSFTINHRRTDEDLKRDQGRNLRIFEKYAEGPEYFPEPRMAYYYGKELYDAGKSLKAVQVLKEVIAKKGKELDPHDRIMAVQYLSMALGASNKWEEALHIALQGLQIDSGRAEYWCLAGDACVKLNRLQGALGFYNGAKWAATEAAGGLTFTDPLAKTVYPRVQLATMFQNMGNLKALMEEVDELKGFGADVSAFEKAIETIKDMGKPKETHELVQSEDVIISTPPGMPVTDWDETTLATKGLGGSETAAVEIAKWIKKKTGRDVLIFNARRQSDVMPSGVHYLPLEKLREYVFRYKPKAHLAWRHAVPLTPAPTFVWSHDLLTPGADPNTFEKYIALSGFQKEFTRDMMGIPEEKIAVLSNGINPEDYVWPEGEVQKNPYKIIFSSSPDRGMERCIEIVKLALQDIADLELHTFYGFENMKKAGMVEEVERLEKLIKENDFVHHHGFVSKRELARHFAESSVWLYPADFIETHCISALEALAGRAYPLVRNMGALPYTLKEAIEKKQATILDVNAETPDERKVWAQELVKCIRQERWKAIDIDMNQYSWENAADSFISLMGI